MHGSENVANKKFSPMDKGGSEVNDQYQCPKIEIFVRFNLALMEIFFVRIPNLQLLLSLHNKLSIRSKATPLGIRKFWIIDAQDYTAI